MGPNKPHITLQRFFYQHCGHHVFHFFTELKGIKWWCKSGYKIGVWSAKCWGLGRSTAMGWQHHTVLASIDARRHFPGWANSLHEYVKMPQVRKSTSFLTKWAWHIQYFPYAYVASPGHVAECSHHSSNLSFCSSYSCFLVVGDIFPVFTCPKSSIIFKPRFGFGVCVHMVDPSLSKWQYTSHRFCFYAYPLPAGRLMYVGLGWRQLRSDHLWTGDWRISLFYLPPTTTDIRHICVEKKRRKGRRLARKEWQRET